MTNKPMFSVERELLESAVECLERCQDQAFQSCECEQCLECGEMPDGCSGTECAKTCQCSTCEHCCNEQAIKELRAILDKPANRHQADPVAWSYCPECGCEELRHACGEHKQCKNCHQEWFSDIDYSEVVRGNLQKIKAEQPAPVALTVWYGSMPESNGKTNWTAILYRKGDGEFPLRDISHGITIDRSEYRDRVRYEADRMRYLIGELTEEPDILDYDDKLHSDYVYPHKPAPAATVAKLLQAIHEIEGFPGVTGDQLRELAEKLSGD